MDTRVKQSDISIADWICYYWIPATYYSEDEPRYLRGLRRPLDESMELAGGSIKDLKPYLHNGL